MSKFDELVNKPGPGGFARPKSKPDTFATETHLMNSIRSLTTLHKETSDATILKILRWNVDALHAIAPTNIDAIEGRAYVYVECKVI